jgi:hypothetical protein
VDKSISRPSVTPLLTSLPFRCQIISPLSVPPLHAPLPPFHHTAVNESLTLAFSSTIRTFAAIIVPFRRPWISLSTGRPSLAQLLAAFAPFCNRRISLLSVPPLHASLLSLHYTAVNESLSLPPFPPLFEPLPQLYCSAIVNKTTLSWRCELASLVTE